MNIKTLSYWHKLEHFYPYILEEQHSQKIKTFNINEECDFPNFMDPLIPADCCVRYYEVYLGIFKVNSALTVIAQQMDAEKEFRDESDETSCFCKFRLSADSYGDDYQKRLDVCNESLKKMKTELEQKHKSNEHMMLYTETYIDKYKKALNTYQTNLVQQIKVPLYVYSGKVIQNYPMGLGVIANIKSSTIVFETEKKEEDVFHYLSAGQLNGVMLSVMLAVRSIVDLRQSLNIIMIDDPLQTIDDVSAFSYADLLAEQFDDAQIVLSTHEADKSNLLEFKFRQHERTVEKYNMHDRYLGIK